MPADSKDKPKRRRPVVEEIPSTPSTPEPVTPVEQPKPHVVEAPVAPEPRPEPIPVQPVATPSSVATSSEATEKKAEEVLKDLETAQHDHRKNNRRVSLKLLFGLTILIALVVGFIAGGLYVYTTGVNGLNSNNEVNPSPSPTSTPTPTMQPTPTPEPVDLSELTVSVLNGSGVIGAAGEAETILEDAGFTVGNTGNASRFNFTDTIIQVKEDVPQSVVDQIEEALSEEYSVEVGDELPETSQYDIVVTVGSE